MTPKKTWTINAENIVYDKLEITIDSDQVVHYRRGYRYVDINGLEMKHQGGEYTAVIAWADVPANVRNGLTKALEDTQTAINAKEGIV